MPKKATGRRGPARKGCPGDPRTGAVTSKHELQVRVTDFFTYDYIAGAGPNKHYFWDIQQNLFNNNPAGLTNPDNQTFCRVKRCRVFIQPMQGVNSNTAAGLPQGNREAVYTVNIQTPGVSAITTGTQAVNALNVQVTNVLPSVDPKWKQVFSCNYDQTFKSGDKRPFYYKDAMCLFSMQLIDPIDGGIYDSGSDFLKVLVKVVIDVDQPILPIQTASKQVFDNSVISDPAFPNAAGGPPPKPTSSYAQMDLIRRLDDFR